MDDDVAAATPAAAPAVALAGLLACPRCRGDLGGEGALECVGCGAAYPVVAGIPDLRVAPDPWIGLEDDRAKALRVAERVRDLPFEDAVRVYWEMTPSTPGALAARFIDHVVHADRRSAEWLDGLAPVADDGPWLDVGCGTGDLLVPLQRRGVPAVGADIALRWLVVARRRPELADAPLVCCCAEALPFRPGAFGRVSALGLLEHCADETAVLTDAARVLRGGGRLHVRTVNRFAPTREPHVGVRGVGWLPRRWADRYVRFRSGQRYLHHRPISSAELRRGLRRAGFVGRDVVAARPLDSELRRLGPLGRRLAGVYSAVRATPALRRPLSWIAPLLEAEGTRP